MIWVSTLCFLGVFFIFFQILVDSFVNSLQLWPYWFYLTSISCIILMQKKLSILLLSILCFLHCPSASLQLSISMFSQPRLTPRLDSALHVLRASFRLRATLQQTGSLLTGRWRTPAGLSGKPHGTTDSWHTMFTPPFLFSPGAKWAVRYSWGHPQKVVYENKSPEFQCTSTVWIFLLGKNACPRGCAQANKAGNDTSIKHGIMHLWAQSNVLNSGL